MRCVAYIGLSLLCINAAGAAELGSAPLRGSRAYEAAPSYPIFPPNSMVSRHEAVPVAAVVAPVLPAYSFEVGARY